MKSMYGISTGTSAKVASLAEAWIEMRKSQRAQTPVYVASLAEAWIEIWWYLIPIGELVVASLAEAWIEMPSYRNHTGYEMSPPSRRRGLKSLWTIPKTHHMGSPPSRRRGLKYCQLEITIIRSGRLLRGGVD